jgi:lambda repressor-like predicted transcriptional regulator
MKQYLINVGVALSILLAALLGGQYRQSTSAMTVARKWKKAERLINWLFQDPRHCWDSWKRYQKRSFIR